MLWGDPVQIQQVLVNLVRNAFEALAQSQAAEPNSGYGDQEAERGDVDFAVSDNGEGIPPDRLDRIFDAYFSTRAGGMGMGLAISRTIVEAHHGRLSSNPSPGSRRPFGFTLPADRVTMRDPTVYIVDDDPDMRDSLRWLLKTVGLRTVTFSSAEEFLRGFTGDGPACLVLDVRMPGTSGLDLFEELTARGLRNAGHLHHGVCRRADGGPGDEVGGRRVPRETVQRSGPAREGPAGRPGRRRAASSREAGLDEVRARLEKLTGKEREVLGMIQDGRPNKEIAARLEVTPRAVELRRASLMRKLGVSSLPELLRLTIGREAASGRPSRVSP